MLYGYIALTNALHSVKKRLANRHGVTLVEYAVLAAAMLVGVIVTINAIGGKVKTNFSTINTNM